MKLQIELKSPSFELLTKQKKLHRDFVLYFGILEKIVCARTSPCLENCKISQFLACRQNIPLVRAHFKVYGLSF